MLAFLAMLPLAITSTAGWVRRLGFKRWKNLHKLIYLTAIAAVIHYWWSVKSDIRLPLMYAAIVTVLLGYRVIVWMRDVSGSPRRRSTSQPATLKARAELTRKMCLTPFCYWPSTTCAARRLPRLEESAPPRNCVPGAWPCTARRPPGG